MRVRKLDAYGDMTFGSEQGDFFINQPEAVAQVVTTRLQLQLGEWYLDTTDGMDWQGGVLGNRTKPTRDPLIRRRVLQSPGVTSIDGYASSIDPETRRFNSAFYLNTAYGAYQQGTTQFIYPPLTPAPQPPPKPVNVQVSVIDEDSILVAWQPYAVP